VRPPHPPRPAPATAAGVPITDAEFLRFRDFFYRQTGIFFAESKRYYVDRRLEERIAATGASSFQSYFALLHTEAAGDEMQRLISRFTVNETYFYREEDQFRCLTASLLPRIAAEKRRGEPIRIWSIPCCENHLRVTHKNSEGVFSKPNKPTTTKNQDNGKRRISYDG
jgi:chemotaxis protein methyltransferase CheR